MATVALSDPKAEKNVEDVIRKLGYTVSVEGESRAGHRFLTIRDRSPGRRHERAAPPTRWAADVTRVRSDLEAGSPRAR